MSDENFFLRSFHKIMSYTGKPFLSRLLFYLLKFNCDIYRTKNHYITIKLFDFNYGQKILPLWYIIKNAKKVQKSNGNFLVIQRKMFCINESIGFLEAGYGFIKKYNNRFVKKYTNKLYYSFEITAVIVQLDVVFRWAPLIYRFDNGMAIKIRLLNISLVNSFANFWIDRYDFHYPISVDFDEKGVWTEDEKLAENWYCVNTSKFLNSISFSWITKKSEDFLSFSQKLKKFFRNLLFNISITFYFFDDCKDKD